MIAPLSRWWLAVQILGAAGLPITRYLFGSLSLKTYAFSKMLGLLAVGYGVWLLTMLGLIRFDVWGLVLTGLVVFTLGLWALGRSERRGLLATLRSSWAVVLACEVFFAGAFVVGLWLRWNGATGGAITGTEKPMDLAFLSGILQSTTFPPHDPWLAGYGINYYYGGYMLVAVLAKLSRVSIGEAFNLGFATVFASAAIMSAGLVLTLIDQTREEQHDQHRSFGAGVAAQLGVVFVLILGNQAGAVQRVIGAPESIALDGRQLISAIEQRLQGKSTIRIAPPIQAAEFGVLAEITPDSAAPFNWWWPSRAVWDEWEVSPGVTERRYAITEFPFFSFYLGDLHPHVLALPFGLLALALSLAVIAWPSPRIFTEGRRRILFAVFNGVVLGSLYMINSWIAPTYGLIFAGALVLGHRRWNPDKAASRVLREALGSLLIVVLAAGVALIPFLASFQSFAGGSPAPEPWSGIPLIRSLGEVLLPVRDHTSLYEFISMFGLFALILLAYAGSGRTTDCAEVNTACQHGFWSVVAERTWIWSLGALVVGIVIGMPLLVLLPLALGFWLTAWRCAHHPVRAFVLWAAAVGALVVFGADVVFLRDPFENRMNTVFKFYYQAWLIWGPLAAYGIWGLWRKARRRPFFTAGWGIPALLLFAGALVYPAAALGKGQPWVARQRSLDGMAFLADWSPDEAAALEWIMYNTEPRDIVLTAVGSSYDDSTGRVAAVTGRPTLLGWSGSHERLWRRRSPDVLVEIARRERDVPAIYTTTDATLARHLLEEHDVGYVYIGTAERRLYDEAGLEKFDVFLERVFEQGDVRVFRCPRVPKAPF